MTPTRYSGGLALGLVEDCSTARLGSTITTLDDHGGVDEHDGGGGPVSRRTDEYDAKLRNGEDKDDRCRLQMKKTQGEEGGVKAQVRGRTRAVAADHRRNNNKDSRF